MPPKKKVPAPIDRPLSRAYLRQFSGWSTAYPPGISEPTSLRIMENVMVNRDGSLQIRPGLRYASYAAPDVALFEKTVGTIEPFFLGDGTKAYLFAVREEEGDVGFRVFVPTAIGTLVKSLADVDFTLPDDPEDLNFTSATTYVKYLQIDNKIFALSNAGEPMRLFYVGTAKSAKLLTSIDRPAWSTADKLSVVHPEAAWIESGAVISTRTNLAANPSFETGAHQWSDKTGATGISRSDAVGAQVGNFSGRLESLPTRTNLMPYSLTGPVSSLTGWTPGTGLTGPGQGTFTVNSGWARISLPPAAGFIGYANGPVMPAVEGRGYRASFDVQVSAQPLNLQVLFRFYTASGAQVGADQHVLAAESGRTTAGTAYAPAGASQMIIFIRAQAENNLPCWADFRNVVVHADNEVGTYFNGASGANYFWTGPANASASVYHPPRDIRITTSRMPVSALATYRTSIYVRPETTIRSVTLAQLYYTSVGSGAGDFLDTPENSVLSAWTRMNQSHAAPANAAQMEFQLRIAAVPRGEYHFVDALLVEASGSLGAYFDGSSASTSEIDYSWTGVEHDSASTEVERDDPAAVPSSETKTDNTLISDGSPNANTYNFGFFYVFFNEVGETAASQVTVVKTQRSWSQWKWETANVSGEPSGTGTNDPQLCADQLVAIIPSDVFAQALVQGAIGWKLYMITWSDQDPVPVSAVKVAERKLTEDSLYGSAGWLQATPQQIDASAEVSVLPNLATRYNYSNPSRGGQGLVAADRMILVNDPTAQAVIRWSSNLQGSYTDFTANKGGGYKTLTSGNLYVPACVKLWQNPQSVDTLTILCMGVDGYSTGYYMQPAQIASQSEATNIMGFEETTATPGTVSPYGCEVLNNALYHPLDEMIMKSTATNYNINHSSITDLIQNVWCDLPDKHHVVSSQLDNRLYFLVNNPRGEQLNTGCWGNEVWVYDAQQKAGTWSRWLVQGQSLRKMQVGDQVVMGLTRPEGIYYFDPEYDRDQVVQPDQQVWTVCIPWRIETNTQGANRAHDAWAHLQQANINVGNFNGMLRYGVRGYDLHGKMVTIEKTTRSEQVDPEALPYDLEDKLLIRRDLKEWFFFASSVVEEGEVRPSRGQLNLVEYRYTPVSVNVGYEFGSVETFEYGRAGLALASRTTDNGVPMPYIDTGTP